MPNEPLTNPEVLFNPETRQYGMVDASGTLTILNPSQVPRETLAKFTPDLALTTPPPLTFAQKMVRGAAPSIIGGALGGLVGTAAAPFTGGVLNPVTGAMLGSAGGEALNQTLLAPYTGATKSPWQIGLAGALPAIPGLARTAVTNLPGAEAGLQNLVVRGLKTLPQRLGPTESPEALFEAAKHVGAQVPKGPMGAAMGDVAAREVLLAPGLRSGLVKKAVTAVQDLLDTPGADVPLETLLPNLQRLGAIYRASARKGGPAHGALGELYAGLQSSLERAATTGKGPGVDILRQANTQFKRGLAASEMRSLVQKALSYTGGHEAGSADRILTALEPSGKLANQLSKWVDPKELDDIRKILQTYAGVATISPASKSGVSGMGFAQRALVAPAIGGALGFQLGGAYGAAGGVVAAEALTHVLMSPVGRSLIRTFAKPALGGRGLGFDRVVNLALQGMREASIPLQPPTAP